MADWYAVFNASTGINPQSGQLANMAATNSTNNGLPRYAYSITGDPVRARVKPSMTNFTPALRPRISAP